MASVVGTMLGTGGTSKLVTSPERVVTSFAGAVSSVTHRSRDMQGPC